MLVTKKFFCWILPLISVSGVGHATLAVSVLFAATAETLEDNSSGSSQGNSSVAPESLFEACSVD